MTDMVERLDLPTALKLLKERETEIERLRTLAAKVCWFDWSNNDSDAVEAVADLRKALSKSGSWATPLQQSQNRRSRPK